MAIYRVLDIFFFVFHSVFIVFTLSGWAWRRTRCIHLAAVLGTAFSWFVLGLWFGFGYCPCTHWHWLVRCALGDADLPTSYIKFLVDKATGGDINATVVDVVTIGAFAVALILSLWLNIRDRKGARPSPS